MKIKQGNTLESVKSCLLNSDLQGARDNAELLRNTSLWPEVMKAILDNSKVENCSECGNERKIYINEATLSCETYCGECADREMVNREENAKRQEKTRLESNIEKILKVQGVPKRLIGADIKNYSPAFAQLIGSDKGYFFYGGVGVGKSHLAVAIMRAEILKLEPLGYMERWRIDSCRMPLFVSIPDLLLDIRSTFNGHGSERDIIDKHTTVERLILDDLGAEKTTDWVLQTLYTIIDRRNREMLWTTITSNLSIDEIAKKLDDRIASRIAEMCIVQEIEGKDRRIS